MDFKAGKTVLTTSIDPIQELRTYLRGHSQTSILRQALGHPLHNAPSTIEDLLVIVIDCESFERKHEWTTEIGMTVIDSREVRQYASNPGPHGENYYKGFYYYHARHKPYAHCINRKFVPGDPTANRFGNTKFLTTGEIKLMLQKCFAWPIVDGRPDLGYCSVVFMGHALRNDVKMLYESFDFDADAFGTIVAELDPQIGLADICMNAGFRWQDSHTAGNDAAYTAIGATAMVLDKEFAHYQNSYATKSDVKSMQDVITETEAVSKETSYMEYGIAEYCIKCGRDGHSKPDCRKQTWCAKCQKAGRRARSHCDKTCTWVG